MRGLRRDAGACRRDAPGRQCSPIGAASADPFAKPERLTRRRSLLALRRASTCWRRSRRTARPTATQLAAAVKRGRPAGRGGRHLVRPVQPRHRRAGRAPARHRARRRSSTNTRSSRRPLPARPPRDPRVAERFELYACGVELANAFGELTNAAEQRRRFEMEMAEKMRVYGESYPARRGFSRARSPTCRRQRASRSASTGSSCWRPAPPGSNRCCGRRLRRPAHECRPYHSDGRRTGEAGLIAPAICTREHSSGSRPVMPSPSRPPWRR